MCVQEKRGGEILCVYFSLSFYFFFLVYQDCMVILSQQMMQEREKEKEALNKNNQNEPEEARKGGGRAKKFIANISHSTSLVRFCFQRDVTKRISFVCCVSCSRTRAESRY